MACLPITDSASLSQTYYSAGGGSNVPSDAITASSITCVSSLNFPNSASQGGIYISSQLTFCDTAQLNNPFLNISNGQDGNGNQVGIINLQPSYGSGDVGLWASSDGTAGIWSGYPPQATGNPPSTLSVYADNVLMSSITVSSINGAAPGGAIPEDLTLNSLSTVNLNVSNKANMDTLSVSSIALQGVWPVPLFQNGRFTMPNAASNVVETDVVFSDTTWFATAVYDGAVQSAVSSIGTEVLSRSTFALYAQGGLGVSWMVLGN